MPVVQAGAGTCDHAHAIRVRRSFSTRALWSCLRWGGIERSGVRVLPWSSGDVDTPVDFTRCRVASYADAPAGTAIELGATAVRAPIHHLESPLTLA